MTFVAITLSGLFLIQAVVFGIVVSHDQAPATFLLELSKAIKLDLFSIDFF